MRRRTALHLPLLAAWPAFGQPGGAWRADLPDARRVGAGTFRWWGLRVYDVALWTADGRFDADRPHVLDLTYHVAVSRERFVDTSLDEMRRGAGTPPDAATLERWRAALADAFPDVAAGDRLAGLHRPGEGCRFYDARRERKRVDDAGFAAAFFGIWLGPRPRDAALQRALLGGAS